MEKKLITVFTFGILAISISNLLLSVGVVSFLLLMNQDTSSQSPDGSDFRRSCQQQTVPYRQQASTA